MGIFIAGMFAIMNSLLTVKELSAALQVKEKTLYQWAELGQIPSLKLNGAVRFDMGDVQAWIDSCKKEPTGDYNISTKLEALKGGKKK